MSSGNTSLEERSTSDSVTLYTDLSLTLDRGANDADNPIAASHKGPTIFYMAKVSNAASASASGQQWFKVAEDGLDGSGNWGVDRMIQNGGWQYFDMPKCVANGNYLLRVELLALHSAYSQGGAQFYVRTIAHGI